MKLTLTCIYHVYFPVISAIAVCRVTAQAPKPSTPHGCQFWSSMAHELTHIHERVGEALHMACVNDKNADGGGCQEMKCGGKFQENTKVRTLHTIFLQLQVTFFPPKTIQNRDPSSKMELGF